MRKVYIIREKSSKAGGAEIYLSRLIVALKKNSIDYQVINSIFPKFFPSWLRITLFNFQVCLTKKDRFYFSLERTLLSDIYRAGDGVHKKFLSIQKKSKLNLLHPIYLFLEKQIFMRSKYIIANSQMVKDEIVNMYDINPNKIKLVYNGYDRCEYNPGKSFEIISEEFNLDKNDSVILFVGSGFKRKGVEEFLYIVSRLKTRKIKAFVVGKEKNIRYYQKLANDLKVADRVIFTGPRNNIVDFYVISDVFLFPAHYEPFGNVILEAMNYDNAVFTTKFCGASELLNDEDIMKSPKDFSVVDRIDSLLNNKSYLEEIKQDNKLRASNFTMMDNLDKTLDIIVRAQKKL